MPLSITDLLFSDVTTISIPTDAVLIVPLLIVFVLLGYFFNNILDNQTNQLIKIEELIDDYSNLELVKEKLEDQLIIQSTSLDQQNLDQPKINQLHFLSPSKFWGLSGLAVVAIGGTSLLALQSTQKSYEGVNTSQVKIMSKNPSTNLVLSMVERKPSDKDQIKIKKITYVEPLLSTINNSTYNNYQQVKDSQTEKYFIF